MSRLDCLIVAGLHLLAALLPASWRDEVKSKTAAKVRKAVLDGAADQLDHQAQAHREAIYDYTDLLRVWADSPDRWEAGR